MHPARLRRRRLGLLIAALAFLGASVLLPVAMSARADTTPPAGISCTDGIAKTCTQNDPTHFAYIPLLKKSGKDPGHPAGTSTVAPSVTVTQTTGLTYQTVQVSWQNFTPSFDQDGGAGADQTTAYGLEIFECRGTDPQIPPASNNQGPTAECYTASAASPFVGASGLGNAAEGFTSSTGSGQTNIAVETNTENSLLRCSTTVPCSLAIVPNWGGEQNAGTVDCSNHKGDTTDQTGQALIASVAAPCSWADRIVVPLTFAPTPANCSGANGFASVGSPNLEQAMSRWRPSWCAGAHGLDLDYDSGTTESQARDEFTTPTSALSQSTDVGFTSLPATSEQASQRAFTYAPVANTGVVVAFVIDDPTTGQQLTHITLNARLMAKLLTNSYSLQYSAPVCVPGAPSVAQTGCGTYVNNIATEHYVPCTASMPQSATCDPAVAGNPANIVVDPEFRALNPSLFPVGEAPNIATNYLKLGEFLPIIAGGSTDVTYALTNWIESDPEAHAFLAGAQDGYGMHVNSYYKNAVDWPSDQLESLDPGYSSSAQFAGFGTMQVSFNPVESLDSTVQSLLAGQPTNIDTSDYGPAGCNVSRDPTDTVDPPCSYSRQSTVPQGSRVLFAVMDAADASNFGFPTATLINSAGVDVDADSQSISAAVHDVSANPDGITTSPDYSQQIGDPAAYPMAITDYAMVPTCDTATSTASSIVRFLGLAAGATGQTNGLEVGELSPGYASLSATQRTETQKAATEVAAQRTCLPGQSPSTSGIAASGSGGVGGSSSGDGSGTNTSQAVVPSSAEIHTLGPNNAVASVRYGVKAGIGAGPLALLIALVVVVGLGLFAAGPGTWWVATTASGAAAFARLRRVARR